MLAGGHLPHPHAGYFARNMRTIEVLLDRDAVTSGQAAAGQPWQYYASATDCAPTPSSSNAAPDGLRQMRLLYSQGLDEGPVA